MGQFAAEGDTKAASPCLLWSLTIWSKSILKLQLVGNAMVGYYWELVGAGISLPSCRYFTCCPSVTGLKSFMALDSRICETAPFSIYHHNSFAHLNKIFCICQHANRQNQQLSVQCLLSYAPHLMEQSGSRVESCLERW